MKRTCKILLAAATPLACVSTTPPSTPLRVRSRYDFTREVRALQR